MIKVNRKVENPKFWDKNVVIGIISMIMTLFFGIIGLLNITVVWGKVFICIGFAIAWFLILFFLWRSSTRYVDKRMKDIRDEYNERLNTIRELYAEKLNLLREAYEEEINDLKHDRLHIMNEN